MKNLIFTTSLAISASLLLAACGPEANSRYGDKHWDPMDTWEKASVVAQPDLTVEYRDTDADENDDVEVWEAYVSIDFTDMAEIATSSPVLSYFQGTSSDKGVDSLLQNGATFNSTEFYYDTELGVDYRLKLDIPGEYNFKLELQVVQPNGTTRDYDFIYNNIIVPGPVTSFNYYTNNVNATLGKYCIGCHGGGNPEASTEFALSSNNVTTRRNNLLNKIDSPTADKEPLTYPFTDGHTGSGDANSMTAGEKAYFQEFITLLLAEKTDNSAIITNDLEIKVIPKPSIMANDPWQP
ncbi:hypothetical protein [Reinekea sp.]|uniref:hypothetical protein n=1 Tax=Reinekea sp. TaxID=1970455 RepID=UPI00398932E8